MTKLLEAVPLFFYDVSAIIFYYTMIHIFKNKDVRDKRNFLYVLCAVSLIALLINDYCFYLDGWGILTLLPFQLCYIAVFLIPIGLLTKRTLLLDFAFYVCVPGAFAALLIPSRDYIAEPYSLLTLSFFIFHFMNVGIPSMANRWGIYDAAPSFKKAARLSLTIVILGGFMHLINISLGAITQQEINYFFTIIKYSAPTNPAYALFASLIPYDFFYLMPIALIVLYGYMGIVYLAQGLSKRVRTK